VDGSCGESFGGGETSEFLSLLVVPLGERVDESVLIVDPLVLRGDERFQASEVSFEGGHAGR